jgi:hypothetical protein
LPIDLDCSDFFNQPVYLLEILEMVFVNYNVNANPVPAQQREINAVPICAKMLRQESDNLPKESVSVL